MSRKAEKVIKRDSETAKNPTESGLFHAVFPLLSGVIQ